MGSLPFPWIGVAQRSDGTKSGKAVIVTARATDAYSAYSADVNGWSLLRAAGLTPAVPQRRVERRSKTAGMNPAAR